MVDSDADGLDDDLEADLGTDPYAADTDGDGYDDAEELLAGSDPNDASEYPIGNSVIGPSRRQNPHATKIPAATLSIRKIEWPQRNPARPR